MEPQSDITQLAVILYVQEYPRKLLSFYPRNGNINALQYSVRIRVKDKNMARLSDFQLQINTVQPPANHTDMPQIWHGPDQVLAWLSQTWNHIDI